MLSTATRAGTSVPLLVDPHRRAATDLDAVWSRSPSGLVVPRRARRRYDRPVAVDLFAGAGGFGLGFHQAGFHVAAASEFVLDAALTYMVNLARPGVRVHFDTPEREAIWEDRLSARYGLGKYAKKAKSDRTDGLLVDERLPLAGSGWIANQGTDHPGCEQFFAYDVRNLTGEIILDALGLEAGDVAAVIGGPPCQGYSMAGKRDVMDPRNSLLFEFARLVCEIRPRTFVMENVPGLLSMVTPEGIPVIDAFCKAVDDGGYGEYEALRAALGAAGTNARAGLRGGKSKPKRTKRGATPDEDTYDDDGDVQESLFDLDGD